MQTQGRFFCLFNEGDAVSIVGAGRQKNRPHVCSYETKNPRHLGVGDDCIGYYFFATRVFLIQPKPPFSVLTISHSPFSAYAVISLP